MSAKNRLIAHAPAAVADAWGELGVRPDGSLYPRDLQKAVEHVRSLSPVEAREWVSGLSAAPELVEKLIYEEARSTVVRSILDHLPQGLSMKSLRHLLSRLRQNKTVLSQALRFTATHHGLRGLVQLKQAGYDVKLVKDSRDLWHGAISVSMRDESDVKTVLQHLEDLGDSTTEALTNMLYMSLTQAQPGFTPFEVLKGVIGHGDMARWSMFEVPSIAARAVTGFTAEEYADLLAHIDQNVSGRFSEDTLLAPLLRGIMRKTYTATSIPAVIEQYGEEPPPWVITALGANTPLSERGSSQDFLALWSRHAPFDHLPLVRYCEQSPGTDTENNRVWTWAECADAVGSADADWSRFNVIDGYEYLDVIIDDLESGSASYSETAARLRNVLRTPFPKRGPERDEARWHVLRAADSILTPRDQNRSGGKKFMISAFLRQLQDNGALRDPVIQRRVVNLIAYLYKKKTGDTGFSFYRIDDLFPNPRSAALLVPTVARMIREGDYDNTDELVRLQDLVAHNGIVRVLPSDEIIELCCTGATNVRAMLQTTARSSNLFEYKWFNEPGFADLVINHLLFHLDKSEWSSGSFPPRVLGDRNLLTRTDLDIGSPTLCGNPHVDQTVAACLRDRVGYDPAAWEVAADLLDSWEGSLTEFLDTVDSAVVG